MALYTSRGLSPNSEASSYVRSRYARGSHAYPAAPQTTAFRHSRRMPRSSRLSTADGLPLGIEIEYQICCTGHAWSTDGGGVAHASPVPLTRERALTYVGRGWPRASYGPGPIPVRALADQWQQEQPQPTSAGPVTSGSQRPRHNGDSRT
jgi:hypothetical protein